MAGLTWTTEPTLLVLFALAVYRLTRLVVADAIAEPLRHRLTLSAYPPGAEVDHPRRPVWGWFVELVGCPWCVSVWLSAGWAGLACLLPVRVSALLAFVLAASALAGLLSSRE